MSPDLNSHMHVHIRHPPMSFCLLFDELVCYHPKVLLLYCLKWELYIKGLNMFLVPINMSIFCFSSSKKNLQLLVPKIFSILPFGPSFKVNSYVEFIFFNKILQKNS